MNLTKKIQLLLLLIGFMASNNSFAQDENVKSDDEEIGFWKSIFHIVFEGESHGLSSKTNSEKGVYRVIDFERNWKFQIGDNEKWSFIECDDESWENIYVPEDWENEGFNGYDGYAWYRIHFDGRLLKRNEAHYAILGFIDDVDETFLNGRLVGRTGRFPPRFRTAYNSNRKYFLSNELINFEGDNVIAVKVYDEYKNGGIVKGKPGIYVSEGSENLLQNLYGPWRFTRHNSKAYSEMDYDDNHWDVLLVPAYWDNQGYRSYDGTAWYRKKFKLSFKPNPAEDYYLLLGRIDDFDVTYLNGEFVGETNDHEPLGQSQSYRNIRVYKIPTGLLSTEEENVIAVKVRDIGIDGGIYDGPVGIISADEVTRMIRSRD
ncbi:MAG: beta galactosidase jelly roll domain-containing protein [Reichenbachiella sp.]|uniref:beta galactosidase jelly roll domain-containing protein n=1 Tax=Reichenbachiella sp. TaxID=2184521 RepID=UPI0032638FD1